MIAISTAGNTASRPRDCGSPSRSPIITPRTPPIHHGMHSHIDAATYTRWALRSLDSRWARATFVSKAKWAAAERFPLDAHIRGATATATRPNLVDTNHPPSTPDAVVPPDAVTAAKASVGVTAFTRKIDAIITCGCVPSVMCRVAAVRPTVKYASAREAASLEVNCVLAGSAQPRNCAGVCIRIKIPAVGYDASQVRSHGETFTLLPRQHSANKRPVPLLR